jgi:hypothetical protein
MTSSLATFLDSIRRALAVMLSEHRANTELLHAISSLLQIDPELRIKPGTLSMSSSAAAEAESPVDVNQMRDSTGGDSEVGPFLFFLRARAHANVLALAPRVHARRAIWFPSLASTTSPHPSPAPPTIRQLIGTWLPSLTSPSDRELELLTRDTDESLYEDQRRIHYSQRARDGGVQYE